MEKFTGELAALGTAIVWAISSTVYSLIGENTSALILNLLKGLVAIPLIVLTIWLSNQALPNMFTDTAGLLLLSGLLGIGLGDTAFFLALNQIGVRNTLLLLTLATPMTAILGSIELGEDFGLVAWLGLILTLFGIVIVITERTPQTRQAVPIVGIVWGIISALTQALGAVLSRLAFNTSSLSPLQGVFLRLVGGVLTVYLLLLLPRHKKDRQILYNSVLRSPRLLGIISLTAFGGTYLGLWLQQTSFKYTAVGIAQTLSSTSPLFALPIAALLGESITSRTIGGVLITLAGVALLFQL